MQDIATFYLKPYEGGHSPLFDSPALGGLFFLE